MAMARRNPHIEKAHNWLIARCLGNLNRIKATFSPGSEPREMCLIKLDQLTDYLIAIGGSLWCNRLGVRLSADRNTGWPPAGDRASSASQGSTGVIMATVKPQPQPS